MPCGRIADAIYVSKKTKYAARGRRRDDIFFLSFCFCILKYVIAEIMSKSEDATCHIRIVYAIVFATTTTSSTMCSYAARVTRRQCRICVYFVVISGSPFALIECHRRRNSQSIASCLHFQFHYEFAATKECIGFLSCSTNLLRTLRLAIYKAESHPMCVRPLGDRNKKKSISMRPGEVVYDYNDEMMM